MGYKQKDRPAPVYGVRRNDELTGWRLELFSSNRTCAFAVVKSFRARLRALHIDFDDARQVALCGLWNAAATFNPSRGVKFVTLAMHCAKMSVLELCQTTQRDRDRWAGFVFHGSDSLALLDLATPATCDNVEFEWLDHMPVKLRGVIRRRIEGATWEEVAKEFGYADAKSIRTVTRAYFNRARAKVQGAA